jgi:hypothetical protein
MKRMAWGGIKELCYDERFLQKSAALMRKSVTGMADWYHSAGLSKASHISGALFVLTLSLLENILINIQFVSLNQFYILKGNVMASRPPVHPP